MKPPHDNDNKKNGVGIQKGFKLLTYFHIFFPFLFHFFLVGCLRCRRCSALVSQFCWNSMKMCLWCTKFTLCASIMALDIPTGLNCNIILINLLLLREHTCSRQCSLGCVWFNASQRRETWNRASIWLHLNFYSFCGFNEIDDGFFFFFVSCASMLCIRFRNIERGSERKMRQFFFHFDFITLLRCKKELPEIDMV